MGRILLVPPSAVRRLHLSSADIMAQIANASHTAGIEEMMHDLEVSSRALPETPSPLRINVYNAAREGSIDKLKCVGESVPERLGHQDDQHGLTPLHNAAISDCVQAAQLLLQMEVQMDTVDNDGHTALHLAAKYNAIEVKDKWGYTALHHAAYNDAVEVAKLLLDNGAAADTKENYGRTALQLAKCYKEMQHSGIVELLKAAEVEPRKAAEVDQPLAPKQVE